MALVIVLSIVAPLCLVVLILGCLNCFMKRKPGFSPFSNPNFAGEGTAGQNNDAFTVDMEPTSSPSDESHVTIETLPDVTPKVVPLPPLRPKILSIDNDIQNAGVSFCSSHRPFPRHNLTYLNPLGVGWFGQVIQSEALRISTGSMRSQVVVKMLKDEASSIEEKQFIDEILPLRYLDHPNVISLLGQCTETRPYLYIVEYAPHGDLKTFLQSHKQNMDTLLKKNKLLHFCLDVAAGVACIHRHDFVHCDLSARNCLVMSDYKIKIGDYGFAEQTFKDDYFQSKDKLLPIRWMAPECLVMMEEGNRWTSQNYSKMSDMWSFGVLLWEVFSMAEQPYDMLTDEAVLQGVVIDRVVSLADIPLRIPFHDRLSGLMSECWKDPTQRIAIESAHEVLEEISKEKVERVADELDFDQKWNHLIPASQSRSQSLASEDGSAIALAGSFSLDTPFGFDDKPSVPPVVENEILDRELSNDKALAVNDDPFNRPPDVQNDLVKGEMGTDQISSIKNEFEINPTNFVTPSKRPTQQMTTSTPLADKSVKSETPPFSTAPNTVNSHYVTAEEDFISDNSGVESGSASQVGKTQEFDNITSTKVNETGQESETQILDQSVKDDSSLNNGMEGGSLTENFNAFDDFISASSNINVSQNSKPQELDASFDIIVPSMLDKDQNSETSTQQLQMPSSSQDASFDFMTDFTENGVQSVSSDNVNSLETNPFSFVSDTNSNQETKVDDAQEGINKSVPHETSENLIFDSGALLSSSSAPPNSTNNNPFSSGEIASPSTQDAGILFNESEIGASSSLNNSSQLDVWDTSFPGSEEPAKDATEKLQQSNVTSPFIDATEGPKEESSPVNPPDLSFFENPPAASDASVVADTINNVATESLFSGFEPAVSSDVNPVSSPPSTGMEDLFGSTLPPSTTTQPSPFFNAEETKTTNVSDFQALSSPDPFDFSAFETGGSIPNASETKPAAQVDIFSSGFNDLVKMDDDQEKKATSSLSSSDFTGLDPFSGETTAVTANPETAGLMLGGDLLTSVSNSSDNQVGISTVYKCDDSNSFPDQSEEEESGVINSCHSLTESSSTCPTTATSTSDSCYVSGIVTDSKNADEVSSSEEISSRAFVNNDTCDGVLDTDPDCVDHNSDSTEIEESSLSNNHDDKGELHLELDRNSINSGKSSNSEDINSSDETSSTSGSEREYICVNPFDTGQPPTILDPDHDKENLDPDYVDKDIPFDDLNEQDLKIVSEIYLSRGVKSPRVFEVPTLETIHEYQPLHCVSEYAIPTPSETSSVGPRDEDVFGSDSYEWDDFYGDSLIGKDDTGLEMDEDVRQSPTGSHQNNISNWSLDFEADDSHCSSNASSSAISTTTLNRSDSACTAGKDNKHINSPISDQKVQSLSDSELFNSKNTVTAANHLQLSVSSTLAKHLNRTMPYTSPQKNSSRDNNFYSLMEDFDDFQLDSSQDESSSPLNLSDDDEFAFGMDKKSHLFHNPEIVSSSSFPSSFSSPSVLPVNTPNSSPHASSLSPKKSTQFLAIDKYTMEESQVSSTSNIDSTSSQPVDLFGLGLDPMVPVPNDTKSTAEQSLEGFSQGVTSTSAAGDPFDSLI